MADSAAAVQAQVTELCLTDVEPRGRVGEGSAVEGSSGDVAGKSPTRGELRRDASKSKLVEGSSGDVAGKSATRGELRRVVSKSKLSAYSVNSSSSASTSSRNLNLGHVSTKRGLSKRASIKDSIAVLPTPLHPDP